MKTFVALLLCDVFGVAALSLTASSSFDFVIVGGGASGIPAAIQLAKKYPAATVAILERGENDADDATLQTQSGWPASINSRHAELIRYKDTKAWTVAGNVLGGGTSINGGVYCAADDTYLVQEWGFTPPQIAQ
jgi:choline dehydrogenase-like flavoprotein